MTKSGRLVVMTCCSIAVFIGTLQLSFADRTQADRARTVRSDIRMISTALQMYKTDTGHFPTQTQGLAALCWKPQGIGTSVSSGPYLQWVPKDVWGNDYVYVFPGKNGKLGFDLYSRGRDGKSATGGDDPDDMNNWDPETGSYYGLSSPIQTTDRRVAVLVIALFLVLAFAVGSRRFRGALTKESS